MWKAQRMLEVLIRVSFFRSFDELHEQSSKGKEADCDEDDIAESFTRELLNIVMPYKSQVEIKVAFSEYAGGVYNSRLIVS